eukprot:COSAG01_NODE_10553_length_2134_cov_1.622113_2_plen_249_part_00
MVIACAQGGTSIEDLAEEDPDQIIKVPIDPIVGITDENAAAVVAGLQVTGPVDDAKEQIKALYNLFVAADCTMVEVNPLAEDDTGKLIAADAKIGFDDNAGFRQKEIFSMRDETQEDPREVAAAKWDLNVRCHSLVLPDSVRGLADACACVSGGGGGGWAVHRPRWLDRLHGQWSGARDGDDGHRVDARRHPRQLPGRGRRRQRGERETRPVHSDIWAGRLAAHAMGGLSSAVGTRVDSGAPPRPGRA